MLTVGIGAGLYSFSAGREGEDSRSQSASSSLDFLVSVAMGNLSELAGVSTWLSAPSFLTCDWSRLVRCSSGRSSGVVCNDELERGTDDRPILLELALVTSLFVMAVVSGRVSELAVSPLRFAELDRLPSLDGFDEACVAFKSSLAGSLLLDLVSLTFASDVAELDPGDLTLLSLFRVKPCAAWAYENAGTAGLPALDIVNRLGLES